ncbi:hypothetical protein FOFC_20674 [Fusarium oxysporum]|nr:hypothetical protein FOFC_20674 [Fusarium oxysporum]
MVMVGCRAGHQRKETISLWHGTERSAAEACCGPYFPVTKV